MVMFDWNDIPSTKSVNMTLQQGDNRIRIVSKPYQTAVHWEKTVDGNTTKIICPGPGCPLCKMGKPAQIRYQVVVINKTKMKSPDDYSNEKVEILEAGPQIFRQIKEYAIDPDYGDPTQYDIKIKKEGSGRDTKYTVKPSPNKTPLNSFEQSLLNDMPNLEEINKPKTPEEILAMNLECLNNNNSTEKDLDDDFGDFEDSWNDL